MPTFDKKKNEYLSIETCTMLETLLNKCEQMATQRYGESFKTLENKPVALQQMLAVITLVETIKNKTKNIFDIGMGDYNDANAIVYDKKIIKKPSASTKLMVDLLNQFNVLDNGAGDWCLTFAPDDPALSKNLMDLLIEQLSIINKPEDKENKFDKHVHFSTVLKLGLKALNIDLNDVYGNMLKAINERLKLWGFYETQRNALKNFKELSETTKTIVSGLTSEDSTKSLTQLPELLKQIDALPFLILNTEVMTPDQFYNRDSLNSIRYTEAHGGLSLIKTLLKAERDLNITRAIRDEKSIAPVSGHLIQNFTLETHKQLRTDLEKQVSGLIQFIKKYEGNKDKKTLLVNGKPSKELKNSPEKKEKKITLSSRENFAFALGSLETALKILRNNLENQSIETLFSQLEKLSGKNPNTQEAQNIAKSLKALHLLLEDTQLEKILGLNNLQMLQAQTSSMVNAQTLFLEFFKRIQLTLNHHSNLCAQKNMLLGDVGEALFQFRETVTDILTKTNTLNDPGLLILLEEHKIQQAQQLKNITEAKKAAETIKNHLHPEHQTEQSISIVQHTFKQLDPSDKNILITLQHALKTVLLLENVSTLSDLEWVVLKTIEMGLEKDRQETQDLENLVHSSIEPQNSLETSQTDPVLKKTIEAMEKLQKKAMHQVVEENKSQKKEILDLKKEMEVFKSVLSKHAEIGKELLKFKIVNQNNREALSVKAQSLNTPEDCETHLKAVQQLFELENFLTILIGRQEAYKERTRKADNDGIVWHQHPRRFSTRMLAFCHLVLQNQWLPFNYVWRAKVGRHYATKHYYFPDAGICAPIDNCVDY